MNLSKTSDYALRILIYMARDEDKLYTAAGLIKVLSISDKYLRRIMTELAHGGLIVSVPGREGGYRFLKSPDSIYLEDVINQFEGLDQYTGCVLGFCECSDENPCALHNSWVNIRSDFTKLFTTRTISELAKNKIEKF